MGCTGSQPLDIGMNIKSVPLKQFFLQCQSLGFTEAYVCKRTIYDYKYIRGLREWILINDKQLFIDEQPVLLEPCQPDQFQQLLEKILNYKNTYLQPNKETIQFAGFPQNIGMLLSKGAKFPSFQTQYLNQQASSQFEIKQGKTNMFIHWKLQEKLSIKPMASTADHSLLTSRQGGLFKTQSGSKFIETAYERATKNINKLGIYSNVEIIGVCMDKPEKKAQYESFIQTVGDGLQKHIWIENDVSMYTLDSNDILPYENQAFQVFRFAQTDLNQPIRGLENSVYLVDSDGVFQCVLQENFNDDQFIEQIKQTLQSQTTMSQEESIKQREQNFVSKSLNQQSLRREDYQRLKKFVTQSLKNKTKDLQFGDTFSFHLEKVTYFANFKKVGAIYKSPILQAASSPKFKDNYMSLMSSIKDDIQAGYIQKDFRRRETIDKVKFFKMITQKIMESGWNDVRFILERHQSYHFNNQLKRFVISRKLDLLHNAPLSVGSVFSRKAKLDQLKNDLLQNEDKLDIYEAKLIKDFTANHYGFTSSFHNGQLYCPIPNLYMISHNDSAQGDNQIPFGTLQMQAQSIYQSKGIFESLQHSQIHEVDSKSQRSQPDSVPANIINLTAGWEGSNTVADLNYDQTHALAQRRNETLIIIQVDFTNNASIQDLITLLELSQQNQWSKDQLRIASIGTSAPDQFFENEMTKNKLDRYMSKGIYEPWFAIDKTYNGVSFNKLLEDLYGLSYKTQNSIIVVDQHKKLAYRGAYNDQLIQILNKSFDGSITNTVYTFDHQLRHRIMHAQYEREWNKIKCFGYSGSSKSPSIQDLESFLPKDPLRSNEFWKLEIRCFQLWNQQGSLIGKFYERPRIGYRFERAHSEAKFEHLNQEFIKLLGEKRLDVNDLGQGKLIQKIQLPVPQQQQSRIINSVVVSQHQ